MAKVKFNRGSSYSIPSNLTDGEINFATNTGELSIDTTTERFTYIPANKSAGYHNSIYRGAYLGDTFDPSILGDIDNGEFGNIYVGDYWVIDNITYRVVGFDYYSFYETVSIPHHILVMSDDVLRTSQNQVDEQALNPGVGGYVDSDLVTYLAEDISPIIDNRFPQYVIGLEKIYTDTFSTSATNLIDIPALSELGLQEYSDETKPINYSIPFPIFQHCPRYITVDSVEYWTRSSTGSNLYGGISSIGVSKLPTDSAKGVRIVFALGVE
jgi:hypothetical protein